MRVCWQRFIQLSLQVLNYSSHLFDCICLKVSTLAFLIENRLFHVSYPTVHSASNTAQEAPGEDLDLVLNNMLDKA